MSYNDGMRQLAETEQYSRWFAKLRDRLAKSAIFAKLARLEMGHFGDCEPVGDGVPSCGFIMDPGIASISSNMVSN
jgi:putative addiction module killer protein